jgi:predicted MFS family arabinose efflux permease
MPTTLWRVLPAFMVAYFLSCLLRNANAVLSPELIDELRLSGAQLGLLTSAYFFAFGASQIPLGILLDRYGARRVESALLVFAAFGALIFALGHSITTLALGRALIGFGASACFMAALKYFRHTYSLERQSSPTAAVAFSCGLGTLSASAPLEAILPFFGWRGAFMLFAGGVLLAAVYVFACVPDIKKDDRDHTTLREQWGGVGQVFRSRGFWRYAPVTIFFNGGYMALVGLWAVPWLMSVDDVSRETAARYLFASGLAAIAGNFTMATVSTRLLERGATLPAIIGTGFGLMLLSLVFIQAGIKPALPFWVLLGFCTSVVVPTFTAVGTHFAPRLFGRASTTLNLMAFVGAFFIQWLFGVLTDLFGAAGWSSRDSMRATLGLLMLLQLFSWLWFVWDGRRRTAER